MTSFNYLDSHIKKQEKFTNDLWEIYQNCTYQVEGKNSDQCEERVNECIKSFALEKDIKGLFENIIVKSNNYDEYGFDVIEGTLFPVANSLYKFINSLEDSELKTKLLQFYEELKNSGNNFTAFDFGNLLDIIYYNS